MADLHASSPAATTSDVPLCLRHRLQTAFAPHHDTLTKLRGLAHARTQAQVRALGVEPVKLRALLGDQPDAAPGSLVITITNKDLAAALAVTVPKWQWAKRVIFSPGSPPTP